MKFSSFLLAACIIGMLYFILPSLIIMVNHNLNLPILPFGTFRWIGIVFVLLGVALALTASATFKTLGKGTPVITEPPKRLVVKGLYTYTRNPIYLAHLIVLTGVFLFFGHILLLVYAIAVAVGLHAYVVTIEEPELRRRFGDDFRAYARTVSRWL